MTEYQELFLIVITLYLIESAIWVKSGQVIFLNNWYRFWKITYPSPIFGNNYGSILISNPLLPLGKAFITENWPISISPKGITTNSITNPQQKNKYLSFSEIDEINANDFILTINKETHIKTHEAENFADLIKKLKQLPENKRASIIENALNDSLNITNLNKVFQQYKHYSFPLTLFCNLLFVYTFIFCPLISWQYGFHNYWTVLVIPLLLLNLIIAIIYYIAIKKIYIKGVSGLFQKLLTIVFYPPAAIRAEKTLSNEIFFFYHPLAVAKVICNKENFLGFAKKTILNLKFPTPTERKLSNEAEEIDQWFRIKLLDCIKNNKQIDLDINKLTAPPRPEHHKCNAYCPRCLSQYLVKKGECENCGGLELEPFSNQPS